jgi:hypothetical protein
LWSLLAPCAPPFQLHAAPGTPITELLAVELLLSLYMARLLDLNLVEEALNILVNVANCSTFICSF